MNLRQCEVFRVVMETGSVTEAALRLGVTQPAVSKILAQFERDLGFQAFRRERRQLVPSPEARALYNEVERAFVSLDYLTRFARDLKGLRQGHLVIGAPHGASGAWMPSVTAAFLRRYPGLSVSMQTMATLQVAHAVATGHIDLGIVQFEVPAQQVQREKLLSVEAVCVLAPTHPLATRRVIEPRDLDGQSFVALAPVDRYRIKLDALLKAEGVETLTHVEAPLGGAACALVMEGMGVAVIDRLTAEDNRHRGIVIRPFEPRIAEDLMVLTPTRRPRSLACEQFIATLQDWFHQGRERRHRPTTRHRAAK